MQNYRIELPFPRTFVLRRPGSNFDLGLFASRFGWDTKRGNLIEFPLVDPSHVLPPPQWQGDPRVWARMRGLTTLMERCLNERIPCALVLNGDVVPGKDWVQSAARFTASLPPDWNLLVFGGKHQHLGLGVPTKVADGVFRPFSIANASAFAWRGFPVLRELYDFVLEHAPKAVGPRDYFEINRPSSRCIYVPGKWIFRSPENREKSGVSECRSADDIYERIAPQSVISVLSHYRGGSSCTAGVLHKLGVSMGEQMAAPDSTNPKGYFECRELKRLSRYVIDHPSLAKRLPPEQIVGLLRQWSIRRSEAVGQARFIGAKHPMLSTLGPEISIAWPEGRYVVVDREPEAVVRSILKTTWMWSRQEAELNVQTVQDSRERFLETCRPDQFIRVDFESLRANPKGHVHRLAEWIGVDASEAAVASAIAHVERV